MQREVHHKPLPLPPPDTLRSTTLARPPSLLVARRFLRDNHGEDRLWWLCESLKTGKRGLAPANFFGLYPTSKHQQGLGFKRFEIPSTPPADNNNTRHKNDERLSLNGSSNFEKSYEISANA